MAVNITVGHALIVWNNFVVSGIIFKRETTKQREGEREREWVTNALKQYQYKQKA